MSASHAAEPASDRYVSFSEINFEANMRAVLQHLMRYIDDPAYANPFWDRFKARLEKAEADAVPVADKLLLMHAHVYYMAELFEEAEDEAAIAALARLEQECF